VSIYHFLEKEAKDLPPFIKQGEVSWQEKVKVHKVSACKLLSEITTLKSLTSVEAEILLRPW
jgi:hypothetical protein